MLPHSRLRLVFGGIATLAVVWATALYVTGGFTIMFRTLRVSTRDPLRPLFLALVSGGCYAWLSGASGVRADQEKLSDVLRPAATVVAMTLSVAVFVIAIRYGTFTASGADSYGYVSQAELWEKGSLHQVPALASVLPWPNATGTLAPVGYMAGPRGDDIVPTYAAGLPLLMVASRCLLGSQGQYYVVPLFGALAVWLTFALGRWLTGSPGVGLSAALVLAASPPFTTWVLYPMSDVPATAAWTLAFLLALRNSVRASAVSGIAASIAILIRPNLAPVAVIIAIAILWQSVSERGTWRASFAPALAFVCGLLPGVVFVAAINANLYGSSLRSGYGGLHEIYTPANVLVNVPRYVRWIVHTGCAYVFVGVAAMLFHWPRTVRAARRAPARFLAAGAVFVICLSYMLWAPFPESEWWYLRFLLPFWPISIVLAAALVAEALDWLRIPARPVALVGIALIVAHGGYRVTSASLMFEAARLESRYPRAAAYVSASTPPHSVILSRQHSGSVRYYAGRVTVRYDVIDPEWLDRGVAHLSKLGYRSYILLDTWEEFSFKRRFAAANQLGRLDWPGVRVAPGTYLYDATGRLAGSR